MLRHPVDNDYEFLELLNHQKKRRKTSRDSQDIGGHNEGGIEDDLHHFESIHGHSDIGIIDEHSQSPLQNGERLSLSHVSNSSVTSTTVNEATDLSSTPVTGKTSVSNSKSTPSSSNNNKNNNNDSSDNNSQVYAYLAKKLEEYSHETQNQIKIYAQQQILLQSLQEKILDQQKQIAQLESSINYAKEQQLKFFAAIQYAQNLQKQQSSPVLPTRRMSLTLDANNQPTFTEIPSASPALNVLGRRVSVSIDNSDFAGNATQVQSVMNARRLSAVMDANAAAAAAAAANNLSASTDNTGQELLQMYQQANMIRRMSLPMGTVPQQQMMPQNMSMTDLNSYQMAPRRLSVVLPESNSMQDNANVIEAMNAFTFPQQRRVSLPLDQNLLYTGSDNSSAQAAVTQQLVNAMRRASHQQQLDLANTIGVPVNSNTHGRKVSLSVDASNYLNDNNAQL